MKNQTMRLVLLLSGVLLGSLSFSAVGQDQSAADALARPEVVRVTPNVYALVGALDVPRRENAGFISNSVFVITSGGVVVVDPGGSRQVGEMIIREIRKVTDKPITHVFNTHHHADHWMGNHAFAALQPKPRIIGHPVMKATAGEIGARWLQIIAEMTQNANAGTEVVLPGETMDGNQEIKIGGTTFRLYHPEHAHTKGDLAFFLPEESVLIAGDILFYHRTPGFQDASPLGNAKALREMAAFGARHVIPGHGPVTGPEGLKYMEDYIALLHAQVHRFYEEGLSDFEMKDRIDVGHYREMSGFDERFGINVNRMYHEVEAATFGGP